MSKTREGERGLAAHWVQKGLGFIAGCLFVALFWVLA
jgi:hypothetical protein